MRVMLFAFWARENSRLMELLMMRRDDLRAGHYIVSVIVRNVVNGDDFAFWLRSAPQQVVAGYIIIVSNFHQESKTAFPDSLFVMGQQSLGNAQVRSRLFLTDLAFLSLECDNA